jgi:hypothetical protein
VLIDDLPTRVARASRRLLPKDVLNIEGALYFCTFFMGVVNSLVVQPVFAAERVVFARERAARMYACLPYAASLVRLMSLTLRSFPLRCRACVHVRLPALPPYAASLVCA